MEIYNKSCFWFIVAVVVFLINQLPFITDVRPVMYDEAWYANTAYHFSQGEGFMNSVVGSGGNANFLLPMLTGTMFWIFGYSLFIIRLTAVLCGVITLLFIHLCLRELKSSVQAEIAVLGFFVSIALYNTIFRFGRPECAGLMCMAGGIWFLLRYIRENSWSNMIGLSLFTYLSAVGHPYTLLFFAIAGLVLFVQTIQKNAWINLAHLAMLLIAAVFSLLSMKAVSSAYDIGASPEMLDRFSVGNIVHAVPKYIKILCMSKHTLYMALLIPVAIIAIRIKDSLTHSIGIIIVSFMILFPFLFSTDIEMIGLGVSYVVLVSTILIAPCLDRIKESRLKMCYAIFALYCVLNIGISYYFNYRVKYERCNTELEQDLQTIIPNEAVVFTPLRQYPMIIKKRCYSDHYRAGLPEKFDYVVLNSQDMDRYENSLNVQTSLDLYSLIYERDTKQYGTIYVYKHE